jgi:FAD/FMN-containing dehydrogenase
MTLTRELRTRFRGALLRPGEEGYEEARRVWNGAVDRRPALIARCAGADDVVEAVRFARDHDLAVSVRGGGHAVAGHAVLDGGLMIDLSLMKAVRVDPEAGTARAAGGVLLGELDAATQRFGLATPSGVVSHTGIGGLTLGGGLGHLMRKHGLTVDNLVAVELVTAEGERLRVDALTEPELFWGLRGGGGNFGTPPPSSTGCTRWARWCSAGRSCGGWRTCPGCCGSCATSPPRHPTSWASPWP